MAKPYFTRAAYFTNPARDLFRRKKKRHAFACLSFFWSGRRGSPDGTTVPRHARGHQNSPPDCFSRFARALFEPLPAIIPKTKIPPCRVVFCFWSGRRGSNSLPRPWQGRALPDELRPQTQDILYLTILHLSRVNFVFPFQNRYRTNKPQRTAMMPAMRA